MRCLVLSLASLTPIALSSLCNAQTCLPSFYGANIPQGATACISPTGGYTGGPVPPILYITGQGGQCDVSWGVFTMSYTQPAALPYYDGSVGSYVTANVAGGVQAYLEWGTNFYASPWDEGFYEGGSALLNAYYDGHPQPSYTTGFTISGVNPSLSSLTADMQSYGPPWYFGRVLTRESSNRQFYGPHDHVPYANPYTPVYGPPDGFGVTQLDGETPFGYAVGAGGTTVTIPKLTDAVLWNWQLNLQEGMGLAWSKQSTAYSFFARQQAQAKADGVAPAAASHQAGTCSPALWYGSGEYGMQDGEWITEYNGGRAYIYNNSSKTWTINTSYWDSVCSNNSATIPNG